MSVLQIIAAHPATPGPLLTRLCAGVVAKDTWATSSVARALCVNPSLPDECAAHLAGLAADQAWPLLMSRPGMDAATALRLLDGVTHPAGWAAALDRVEDADGTLAEAAWVHAQHISVAGAALRRARTPAARHTAAVRLASTVPGQLARRRAVDGLHLNLLGAYLRDHGDRLTDLVAAGLDPDIVATLRPSSRARALAPQDAAQVIAASRTHGCVLEYSKDATSWLRVLHWAPDPDGTLPDLAVEHIDDLPVQERGPVLATVMACLTAAPHTQVAAARALITLPGSARHGQPTAAANLMNRLVATGPLDVAVTHLRTADSARVLPQVCTRPDLPADALDDVVRVVTDARYEGSDGGRSTLRTWALWLATYPSATETHLAQARTWFQTATGTDIPTWDPADAGSLRVAMLNSTTTLPGVRAAVHHWLTPRLHELPAHATSVLVALASDFPGTLTDLFDCVRAVAQ